MSAIVNAEERPEDAARRYATQLEALRSALIERGVPEGIVRTPDGGPAPVDEWPVAAALAALDMARRNADGHSRIGREMCRANNELRAQVEVLRARIEPSAFIGALPADTATRGLVRECDDLREALGQTRAERDQARAELEALRSRPEPPAGISASPAVDCPTDAERVAAAQRADALHAAARLMASVDMEGVGEPVRDLEQVTVNIADRWADWIASGSYDWVATDKVVPRRHFAALLQHHDHLAAVAAKLLKLLDTPAESGGSVGELRAACDRLREVLAVNPDAYLEP